MMLMLLKRPPPRCTLFPYTTLFRSSPLSSSHAGPCSSRITRPPAARAAAQPERPPPTTRSEEHTSELQSLRQLVCRLLLEKKNQHGYRYGQAQKQPFVRTAVGENGE